MTTPEMLSAFPNGKPCFIPDSADLDLMRSAVAWANGQNEDLWFTEHRPPLHPLDILNLYCCVVRFLGSTVEEVVGDLPFPFESYSARERDAINFTRALFGLKALAAGERAT